VKAREKCMRRRKKGLGNLAEGLRESSLSLSGCRHSPSYSSRRSTFSC
jgi:hypothetical protein